MKRTFFVLMAALICSAVTRSAFAGDAIYGFGFGISQPNGGEWGKEYKAASALVLSAESRFNEEHRFGMEMGYDFGHQHMIVKNCRPRVLSFAPFYKEVKNLGPVDFYGVIGAGLYHRWTPAYSDSRDGAKYPTSFSGKMGYNGGFGMTYKKWTGFTLGIDLRFHQIMHFVGIGNSKPSASNVVTTLRLEKNF